MIEATWLISTRSVRTRMFLTPCNPPYLPPFFPCHQTMRYLLMLRVSLALLQGTVTHAQPQWRFHLAFEDGAGARDTLWFIWDTTATVGSDFNPQVDEHLGEGAVEMDLNEFNAWVWNWQLDSTKTQAWPYGMYPIAEMLFMGFNATPPLIIRWDTTLFHADELPHPPIGLAVLSGDYFWANGLEDPLVGGFNMLTADSVLIDDPEWMFWSCGMIFDHGSGLSIQEAPIEQSLISPNPVGDQFTWMGPATHGRIELIDGSGRVVRRIEGHDSATPIDVSGLAAGTYHLRMTTTNNTWHHGKIIKM